jgi:DNA-binding response OmpR family regulator
MSCCGEAASRSEAFAQIAHKSPDGVILDLNLPDGSGLDIVQWIRKHSKEMAIVVLTMSEEESQLIAAMRAGASAFVKKSAPLDDVIATLRSALRQPENFSAAGITSALKKVDAANVPAYYTVTWTAKSSSWAIDPNTFYDFGLKVKWDKSPQKIAFKTTQQCSAYDISTGSRKALYLKWHITDGSTMAATADTEFGPAPTVITVAS